jgi:hypothetical protein
MTSLSRESIVAVALTAASALTIAQARPDFSGKWEISQAKSSAGATSNSANIAFPSELIVTQRPAELHVETRFPRSEPLTTVYKLDGSEITAGTPAGVTEKATATWDGNNLVITARRVVASAFGDFVTDSKEIWTRADSVLTISKTETSDGVVNNERAVYDREQP